MKLSHDQHLIVLSAISEYVLSARAKARIYRENDRMDAAAKKESLANEAEVILRLVGACDAIDLA